MVKRRCWLAVLCLGLLILAGGSRLWAFDPEQREWNELKAKMKAEGWQQISEGVFERRLGASKVENLGYGREGLAWHIGDLRRRLELLREEYQNHPSSDLADVIDGLTVRIALAEREFRNMPRRLTSVTAAVTDGPSCSNICYGATADAFALTSSQGVSAVADAKFNSTCGYSGDTYAFAYAIATKNGTTTTITQEDPHTGTNVTSHAAATVQGGSITGTPCASNAYASAESAALGIFYSTSDSNNSCPVPPTPPAVTITGTSLLSFTTATCTSATWSSTLSNCTSPVTYQWKHNGTVVGSNSSSYSRTVCYNHASFTLSLTATCSNGTASDTHSVTVSYDPPDPPCGIECNCGGPGQPICP